MRRFCYECRCNLLTNRITHAVFMCIRSLWILMIFSELPPDASEFFNADSRFHATLLLKIRQFLSFLFLSYAKVFKNSLFYLFHPLRMCYFFLSSMFTLTALKVYRFNFRWENIYPRLINSIYTWILREPF